MSDQLTALFRSYCKFGLKQTPLFELRPLLAPLMSFEQFSLFCRQQGVVATPYELTSAFNRFKNQKGLLELQGFQETLKWLLGQRYQAQSKTFSLKKVKVPKGCAFGTWAQAQPRFQRKLRSSSVNVVPETRTRHLKQRLQKIDVRPEMLVSWEAVSKQKPQNMDRWGRRTRALQDEDDDRKYLKQFLIRQLAASPPPTPSPEPKRKFSLHKLLDQQGQLVRSSRLLK